jgi:hypothetical protein
MASRPGKSQNPIVNSFENADQKSFVANFLPELEGASPVFINGFH